MSQTLIKQDFTSWQAQLASEWDEDKPVLRVCDGTGCRALGSQIVLDRLRNELEKIKLPAPIDVVGTGCPGFCGTIRSA